MKMLVTGFEPFNGFSVNPSELIIENLELSHSSGVELVKKLLPVEFAGSAEALRYVIAAHRPDAVLSLGQAGNRPEICVERVAINLDNSRSSDGIRILADNAGAAPTDQPIEPDGETAYFSTLPVWELVEAIRKSGIESAVSYSAGTFVCNHVIYTALYEAERNFPQMKAGFIHVPFLPEQTQGRTGGYAMELSAMTEGVQAAVNYLAEWLNR